MLLLIRNQLAEVRKAVMFVDLIAKQDETASLLADDRLVRIEVAHIAVLLKEFQLDHSVASRRVLIVIKKHG